MPTIIRNLPFFEHPTTVDVRGRAIPIQGYQIIVWVSLSELGQRTLHPVTPSIPAVLDTGCNHSFVISETHLVEWAGIHAKLLRRIDSVREYGNVVPQVAANVWLHPIKSGDRDQLSGRPPYLLETKQGIAIVPKSLSAPRLPLLGLRALGWNRLHLSVDCDRCKVTIRTQRRYWLF